MTSTPDLDVALRRLDAAEPAGPPAGPRAAADVETILATDPYIPWGGRPGAGPGHPRRTTRIPLALAGAVLAALVGAVVVLPSPSGGDVAFAGWTPDPAGLSELESHDAAEGCRTDLADGGGADYRSQLRSATTAVAERRGSWTTVALVGEGGFSALCITGDSRSMFGSGMIGSIGAAPDWTPLGPRELRPVALGDGTVDDSELSMAAGHAGADVAGIRYRSPVHGDVTATVVKGFFALWMPGSELAGTSSSGLEVVVTYGDGTTGTSVLRL